MCLWRGHYGCWALRDEASCPCLPPFPMATGEPTESKALRNYPVPHAPAFGAAGEASQSLHSKLFGINAKQVWDKG